MESKVKKRAFRVDSGTYPMGLFVVVGMTPMEIFQYVNRKVKGKLSQIDMTYLTLKDTTRAMYVCSGNISIIILRDFEVSPDSIACLSHEIFHCVYGILTHVAGIYLTDQSEEAFAYEIQYLTGRVLEKLLMTLDKKRRKR